MEKQVVEAPLSSDKVTVDVLAILNRRRGWLVLSCILGLAVGAAYFFLTPKKYESRAELLLMQNESDPASSSYGSDRNISEELLATHMKLVQSPRIAVAALKETPASAAQRVKMDRVKQDPMDGGVESPSEIPHSDSTNGNSLNPEVAQSSDLGTSAPENIASGNSTGAGEIISGLSPAEALLKKNEVPAADASASASNDVAPTESQSSEAIPGVSPNQTEYAAPASALATESAGYEPGEFLAVLPSITSRYTDMPEPIVTKWVDDSKKVRLPTDIDNRIVGYVLGNLSVSTGGSGRARNARVLNIAFRHTDPAEAELVTRAIVHHYREFVNSKFKDINSEAAGLIEKAKNEQETQIQKLEEDYRSFRKESPILPRGATGTDIHTARYEELSAELSQLEIKRDEAAGRLDLVTKTLAELSSTGAHNLEKLSLIDQQNAERLGILVTVERGKAETAAFQSTQPERMAGATAEYGQLLTMKTRLSQLTADFGPEYPEVKSLRQQITEMEGILTKKSKALSVGDDIQLTPDDVMKAYVSMLHHDLRALEQRSKDVQRQMDREMEEARSSVEIQLQDEEKTRARQRAEQLYDAVIQRFRDIEMR